MPDKDTIIKTQAARIAELESELEKVHNMRKPRHTCKIRGWAENGEKCPACEWEKDDAVS